MYEYKLELIRVVDGDTVDGYIDLGFDIKVKKRIRLLGINAPEIRLQSKIKDLKERKAQKELGFKSKRALEGFLSNKDIFVKTRLDKTGKYGRVLGTIYITEGDQVIDINNMLIKEGFAEEY
jgi:endonuclease YncB( thermonuclease family)